jgi:phosphatidylglycerophosphate synthase
MLDGIARTLLGPALDAAGRRLAARGLTADAVTLAGFAVAAAAAAAIALEAYPLGLVLLLLSRLADGLDGAVARHTRKTDLGGFLDITLDFAFYGLVPLAFVAADPQGRGLAGAVLLFSFYANGASFLAYAVMAGKRGMGTKARGPKSLYFTTGLAEATETILVFCAFCLFPRAFAPIAYAFAAVTLMTAGARILLAVRTLDEG